MVSMQFRLRTLLLLMAIVPPALAVIWYAPVPVFFAFFVLAVFAGYVAANLALGYVLACGISAVNSLIGKLQGLE